MHVQEAKLMHGVDKHHAEIVMLENMDPTWEESHIVSMGKHAYYVLQAHMDQHMDYQHAYLVQ